jgi:hypothetical protein
MGVVETTSITQVIEWGKLATFVAFDTACHTALKTQLWVAVSRCKLIWVLQCFDKHSIS